MVGTEFRGGAGGGGMTIHFVYAKGVRPGAPQSITRELASRLAGAGMGEVRVYDYTEIRTIVPATGGGDVLIGHPHADPRTVFQASLRQGGWAKRIVMCPYSHGMPEGYAWMEPVVEAADIFLAITGKYWHETMRESSFSHWFYKTRRLDLAVDGAAFPRVKHAWNPPGKRRFLYIGYPGRAKGTDYLCALAEANPDVHFAWIGWGLIGSGRVETIGPCEFSLPESLRVVAEHDFVINCGRSDANPATILEGLAWGLVPVCTRESGYWDEPWLVNIPLDDVAGASGVLRRLNVTGERELEGYAAAGRRALLTEFTWERFAETVIAAIKGPGVVRPADAGWQMTARKNRERLLKLAGA